MTTKQKPQPLVVGWREWVSLPDLGIDKIKAKVDTGARTSALHAINLRAFRRGGEHWARFEVLPMQGKGGPTIRCEAPVRDHREVRSSSGNTDMRVVIETTLEVAGQKWPIEVTLTNRRDMRFRMLLGRTALRGKALVDPRRSFMTGKP